MTKEQFLEGREFKISEDSPFTFKKNKFDAIDRKYDEHNKYDFHALYFNIENDYFIASASIMDYSFTKTIYFNDLILVQ